MRSAEIIRQWHILREIEASRRTTVHGLSRKTGVTTRTIRRDLDALQLAGFPLYDEVVDGRKYWKLDTHPFRAFAETGLTLSELCAVYFSRTLLECLATTPFLADVSSAFAKIESILTPRMRQFLDRLPHVLQAKAASAKRREAVHAPATISRLLDTTLHERQARIRYHSFSSHRTKDYLVHPYRLVYAEGGLYLVAYVPEYAALRTFAIERIQGLDVLDQSFERTHEVGAELFSHSLGVNQGQPESIELIFSPDVAPYVREREWHRSQILTDQPDGSVRMSLSVCSDWALRSWILSFCPRVRVISPSHLARQIATDVANVRALYPSETASLT